MTIRTDVTIDWTVSPRIITVASPSVEISIQDLYDTCMDLEAKSDAIDDPHIINAAGKEELGPGVLVGLTATLQNALLAFEARSGPSYDQCSVSGGNLVALESDLITYASVPIFPTSFTQVVVTASSSATLIDGGGAKVADFFNEDIAQYTTNGTFGSWLNNKSLTVQKFLGLK